MQESVSENEVFFSVWLIEILVRPNMYKPRFEARTKLPK